MGIRKLPEAAAEFPLLAKLVVLDEVPEASTKDAKIENELQQLAEIFKDFEVVEERNKKLVLKHPNGKTVNEIIKEKLSEASGTTVPTVIQDEKVDVVSKEEIKEEKSNIPALGPV